jgi:hypothetical protein
MKQGQKFAYTFILDPGHIFHQKGKIDQAPSKVFRAVQALLLNHLKLVKKPRQARILWFLVQFQNPIFALLKIL